MMNPMSRFGAMPKLLDEAEIKELSHQPGFETHLARKLRQARRRAFGLYLAELAAEFRAIEKEALDHAANDPGVDPDFVNAVLKIKFRFTVSVWLLRTSLWLPSSFLPGTHRMAVNLVGSLQPLLARTH
jgi:hypothetical protein